MNFITWNYDLNALNSLKNFLFGNYELNDLINRYMHTVNHLTLKNDVDIIHLNGLIQHPKLKDVIEVDKTELEKLLDKLIDSYLGFIENANIFEHSNKINFSWELLEKNKFGEMPLHIQNAKKAISKSNIIVVVGYSFPLYNRIIDTYIFNSETLSNKRLILKIPMRKISKKSLKQILV